MKKLWIQFTIFILPIAVYLLVPLFVLWQSDENFKDIDTVIENDDPYLIGFAYNEQNYAHLKWKCLNVRAQKTVLSVGSSRVLQFRDHMFSHPFYNAGYTVSRAADFVPMLKKIPKDKKPKFLIIAIDQWMLNDSWVQLESNHNPYTWPQPYDYFPDASIIRNVWGGLIDGKFPLTPKKQDTIVRVGINANVFDSGFRNDGSMNQGRTIPQLLTDNPEVEDYQYHDTFSRIEAGGDLFTHGSEVSKKAVDSIDNLLAYCKAANITVIAFLPPFADAVYDRMQQSGYYTYMNKVYPALTPVFRKHAVELYDFSHVGLCGSSGNETLDGFHGSEMTYAKMLLKMLDSGSKLNEVVDRRQLENAIAHPINRYQVYR